MSRPWPAFAARAAVLADLERAIAAAPAALDTRFYYASFLRDHGRFAEAIDVFAEVLAAAPDHLATLVASAAVLARAGRRLDARVPLERALAIDGEHVPALVSLANLLALDDPERASALFTAALAREPENLGAHRGLCSLAALRGDRETAAHHRRIGYPDPFAARPYYGATTPARVLALVSTDGGNTPVESLLDPFRFAVNEVAVEAYDERALPPHAVIVNAIGDADRGAAALHDAERVIARSTARVINAPRAVALTGRRSNAARLAGVPDAIVPDVWPIEAGAAIALPAIVRVAGAHMGRGMVLVDDAAALAAVAAQPASGERIAIRYVDTRSPDGAWRKYRVMAIGGRLFALHLAIAHRWDVHYFSSAMSERAAYRTEEAAFLADPVAAIGSRAWTALERIAGVLGLDYAGIDFGLAPDGRVVVFEANAAMTVLAPDDDERFAYRRPAVERIRAALIALYDANS